MTTYLVIAYILNIFLNRYLNKIVCKLDGKQKPVPFLWFLSLISTSALIIVILMTKKINWPKVPIFNWFIGRNW